MVLAGAKVGGSLAGSLMSISGGRYHCMNAATTSLSRIGPSAFSIIDGRVVSPVVDGYQSSWKTSGGPPLSRASCVITAEMLPPAESPATAIRVGIAAQLGSVLADPPQRRPRVVDALRERMLGRQPVVDRHHDGLGADGVGARHRVVGVQVADRPASAVVEHHHRQVVVLCYRRPVDAHGDVGDIPVVDGAFFDSHVRQRFRWRLQLPHLLAGYVYTVVGGELERERVQQCLHGRVDARPRGGGFSHGLTVARPVKSGSGVEKAHAGCNASRSAAIPRSVASVAAGTTPA